MTVSGPGARCVGAFFMVEAYDAPPTTEERDADL